MHKIEKDSSLYRLAVRVARIFEPADNEFWITRFLFLRLLGAIYTVAFLTLLNQVHPLLGSRGLLPVHLFVERMETISGSSWTAFWQVPSLMWITSSDSFMYALCWLGFSLSLLLLCGISSAALLVFLWVLYLSFVNVGQIFYGYGWEILTLEVGFLAIFLCPIRRPWIQLQHSPPDKAVVWLLRWVLFRVMFGAGLIKLRGDPCWWDLTCLLNHYETQPIPNPISWYLHQLPPSFHKVGVLFNHLAELVAPFLIFGPRRVRVFGGLLIAVFQVLLIVSGNLSWLNYLTLTLCVVCFDDRQLRVLLPTKWTLSCCHPNMVGPTSYDVSPARRSLSYALVLGIAYLSINPIINMISSRQVMNSSFDYLRIVNTYGAFGHVLKERNEIVIEGTSDTVVTKSTEWRAYEFHCKPGDPNRSPCFASPYQHRIDWQMWFAAMSDYRAHPWFVHLVYKMLTDDQPTVDLLATNPFSDSPPTYLRAVLYQYEFTGPEMITNAWWTRRRIREYLPPLSSDNPSLLRVIASFGWPIATNSD